MSSYGWRGAPSDGPRAKCDQVIYEAIAKACEIVVSSRAKHTTNGSSNKNASASSSRFNLQVPEIAGVRSILQDYRLTLHVPIRLDVYYQHEGNRRELLERWCLEYKPASMERFLQAEGVLTQDPLAQLRHVCKRIVLWLRTLYCWTRLLPSQSLCNDTHPGKSPIGFSIYVNSEGTDDISDLTQNQGFRWQGQPSPVVSPYGELAWQVIYVPSVERLLPKFSLHHPISAARPIPLQQQQQQQQHPTSYGYTTNPKSQVGLLAPQSAPSHLAREMPLRGASVPTARPVPMREMRSLKHQQQHHHHHQQQHTYDPSHFHLAHDGPSTEYDQHSPRTTSGNPRHVLRRRHTSVGAEEIGAEDQTGHDSEEPPERVLSGLSLALMSTPATTTTTTQGEGETSVATEEKRHAALHEVPLHLLEPTAGFKNNEQRTAPAATEYGYAYNNHIPWQKIHPSCNPPVVGRTYSGEDGGANHNSSQRTLSCSPSVLGSTPPSGAFLGATPPKTSSLLQNNRSTVTPPFQSRPMGFVHDAPATSFLPPLQPASSSAALEKPAPVPALASLDLLHSSPFQQQQQQQAQLASSSLADSALVLHNATTGASWSHHHHSSSSAGALEDAVEMPFAVDLGPTTTASTAVGGGGNSQTTATSSLGNSSSLYASAAVASFAQKCTPQNRLNLFAAASTESTAEEVTAAATGDNENDVNHLASQLAEFRTFGASLQASGSESTSTSTPISLRS